MRSRWFVLAGCFVAYMFDGLEIILLSFALPFIHKDLGLSNTQTGFLATATLLGIGISSVCVGWSSDNFGRKKTLLLCLAVFGACTALLAAAPGFAVLALLRFAAGIGLGGVWSVLSAFTVENWPGSGRGRAVAFVFSAYPAGGVVAAFLAGQVLPDWRLLFLLAGAGVVIPIAFVARFPESRVWTRERALRAKLDRVSLREIFSTHYLRRTLVGSAVVLMANAAFYGTSTWLPTYLAGRALDQSTISHLLLWGNLTMFVGNNVFGYLADRCGRRTALAISLFGLALALPVYALVSTPTALLVAGIAFYALVGWGIVLASYLGELYPTRVRTTGAGFCFNSGRGIAAFAPLGLGLLMGTTSISTGFLVCAALFAVAGLASFGLPRPTAVSEVDSAPPASPGANAPDETGEPSAASAT
jgi:MFS family permease